MTQQQRLICVFGAVTLCSLVGAVSGKPKPTPPQNNLALAAAGSGTYFQLPDPKLPGKPQLKAWAKAFSGNTLAGGYQGDLRGVSALLFQHGVATAKLSAPHVQGNNLQNLLVASGRATVTSLEKRGSTLIADNIRWYPKTNKIFADGNVVWRDGKTGATMNTPHMQADTALKSISSGV